MKFTSILLTAFFLFTFAPELSAQVKGRKPVPKATPKPTPVSKPVDTAVTFIPGRQDADGWKPYESKEDSFKISFPPTPVAVEEKDGQGKKSGYRYYNPEPVTAVKVSLAVIVSDMGAPVDDPKFQRLLYNTWLEGVMETRPGAPAAKLALNKEFALGSKAGLEVIVDKGSFRFHSRVIGIGNKLYQIAVGSATPDSISPEEYAEVEKWTKKFFDSFQMI
jgi:hypothetical protein